MRLVIVQMRRSEKLHNTLYNTVSTKSASLLHLDVLAKGRFLYNLLNLLTT